MRFRLTTITLAASLFALVSTVAIAQAKPDDAVRYRQQAYQVMLWNYAPMGAMVRGRVPFNAAEFQKRAVRVRQLSAMLLEGFTKESAQSTLKTDAKPEIWTNFADFESKMRAFETSTVTLVRVAKSADEAQMKAQFAKVSETCKACHDQYKLD